MCSGGSKEAEERRGEEEGRQEGEETTRMGRRQQGLTGSVCQGIAAGAVTGPKYSGLKLPSSHLNACPPTVA